MAASDARIKDIIIFNASDTATKPYLAVSGDMDITGFTAAGMGPGYQRGDGPQWLFYHMVPRYRESQRAPGR